MSVLAGLAPHSTPMERHPPLPANPQTWVRRLSASEDPVHRQPQRHRPCVLGLRTGLEWVVSGALDVAEFALQSGRPVEADTARHLHRILDGGDGMARGQRLAD